MLTKEEKYAIAQNVIEHQGKRITFGVSMSQGKHECYLNTRGTATPTLFFEENQTIFDERLNEAVRYRNFIEKNYHGLMQRLLDELEAVKRDWVEAADERTSNDNN